MYKILQWCFDVLLVLLLVRARDWFENWNAKISDNVPRRASCLHQIRARFRGEMPHKRPEEIPKPQPFPALRRWIDLEITVRAGASSVQGRYKVHICIVGMNINTVDRPRWPLWFHPSLRLDATFFPQRVASSKNSEFKALVHTSYIHIQLP